MFDMCRVKQSECTVNTQSFVWKFFYVLYINCNSFIH